MARERRSKYGNDAVDNASLASSLAQTETQSTIDLFDLTQYEYLFNRPVRVTTSLDKPTIVNSDVSLITTPVVKSAYDYGTGILNDLFTYAETGKINQATTVYPYRTYVVSSAMSGANLTPALNVVFTYDGNEFEIIASSYEFVTLWFDEGRGWERVIPSTIPVTISGKSILYFNVKFKSAKVRNFKIQSRMRFGGLNIQTGYNLTKLTTTNTKKIAFVGDSITEGATILDKSLAYPQLVSDAIGYQCINNGIGATGYIADGSTHERFKFYDRLDNDVISLNPDVVVLAGGINDTSYPIVDVQTQVTNCITKLKTSLPNAKIIVLGAWSPKNKWTAIDNVNNAIKGISLQNNVAFIDTINGYTYKSDGSVITSSRGAWFTGVNTSIGDGNAYLYISSDGTHPNQYGHYYISKLLSIELYKLLSA